jgi:RNA polymerase sigma-70 factor (ECF subfamily)
MMWSGVVDEVLGGRGRGGGGSCSRRPEVDIELRGDVRRQSRFVPKDKGLSLVQRLSAEKERLRQKRGARPSLEVMIPGVMEAADATGRNGSADELLARFAAGDDGALAALYDRLAARLMAYARALSRTESDAEEALQEAFLGLVRSRRRLATVVNATGYVFAAVRHATALASRKRPPVESLQGAAILDASDPVARAQGVEEANALLARLSEEQREVVVLKLYSELTFQEIADLLEIPLNTAASRYRYAIARLRALRGGES